MALGKHLREKSLGIGAELDQPVEGEPKLNRAAKTEPGKMFAYRGEMQAKEVEFAALQAQLEQFQGSTPVRKMDSTRIRVSEFANRHESNWNTKDFQAFKREIASAGGNVQPIKVRPITGDPNADFELCYGHRRHRACLDLGLMVSAEIADVGDGELFAAMARENLQRKDLSAYETGKSYKKALAKGLYLTQVQLAAALGMTQGHVSQALVVANLPDDVVNAFPSVLDIQYRWAADIAERLAKDSESVLSTARALATERGEHSAGAVYETLVKLPHAKSVEVKVGGKTAAVIKSKNGVVTLSFKKGRVPASKIGKLKKLAEDMLRDSDD